jgi:hypothetical protein
MPIDIKLNKCEVSAIKALAHYKYLTSRKLGSPLGLYKEALLKDLAYEKIGLAGEWAGARFLDLTINFDTTLNEEKSDRGLDFIYKNKTIDFKATQHPNGRIVTPNKNKLRSDIIFLCYTTLETLDLVKIIGWVTNEDFNKNSIYTELRGFGKRWVLDNKYLQLPETIFNI